jgi:hypothetical protein
VRMLHNCLLSFLCIRFTDSHCIQQSKGCSALLVHLFFFLQNVNVFSLPRDMHGLASTRSNLPFCALDFLMNLFHTNELSGREHRRSHREHRKYALCPEMAPSHPKRETVCSQNIHGDAPAVRLSATAKDAANDDPSIAAPT